MPKNVLLITSTIAPSKGVFLLKVQSPEVRLEHYKGALKFYLDLLRKGVFDHIVYMDNSGYPLDDIFDLARNANLEDRVEILSHIQTVPINNSRYFLEINLIDHAMRNSKVIISNPTAIIWKVTGRYIIANAESIVTSYPPASDLYINLRNYPHKTTDFYFLGFRCETYRRHIGLDIGAYEGMESGEDILRRKIDAKCYPDVIVYKRFRRTPRLKGVRGFDGAQYGKGKDLMKYAVRSLSNSLLPCLWI